MRKPWPVAHLVILCLLPMGSYGQTPKPGDGAPKQSEVKKTSRSLQPDDISARRPEVIALTKLLSSDDMADIQNAYKTVYASPSYVGFYFNALRCAADDSDLENKHIMDDFVRSVAHASDQHHADVSLLLWSVTEMAMQRNYLSDFDDFWSKRHGSEAWWLGSKLHAGLTGH